MSSGRVVAVLAGIGSSVLGLLCEPAVVLAQGGAQEPIPLTIGQRSEATQRADEAIVYRFAAVAGESYFIEVEQRGLDVIVTVEPPSGAKQSYNSPLVRDEREYAVLDAAMAGDYRIAITSNELTNALKSLLVVVERYPELKSDQNFRDLQAQLEGTENRIAVARNRYIEAVQTFNGTVRRFPVNLTAMVFGYDVKPNFTVENEAEISRPPTVDFGAPPATTPDSTATAPAPEPAPAPAN